MESPWHTWLGPVIAGGNGLIVTTNDEKQPVASVYLTVIGGPALPSAGVKLPRESIDPRVGSLLDHAPPDGSAVKFVPLKGVAQNVSLPLIADGTGVTVSSKPDLQPVEVTV